MHSHVLPSRPELSRPDRCQPDRCRPDPRPAGIVRRLARRADAVVAVRWQARRRPAAPWVSWETYPFDADRVRGESYRDYLFRKGV
jgi:hypothetical protein